MLLLYALLLGPKRLHTLKSSFSIEREPSRCLLKRMCRSQRLHQRRLWRTRQVLSPTAVLTLIADLESEDFWNEKCGSIRADPRTLLCFPLHVLKLPYTEKRRPSKETNRTAQITSSFRQNPRAEEERGRKSRARKREARLGSFEAGNRRTVQTGAGPKSCVRRGSENGAVSVLQAGQLREGEEVQI